MSIFVRKHWQKIILALTTVFWSSCDSDSTTKPPKECEGQECIEESSSSNEEPPISSSIESSSSEDIEMSATLYGVFYSSSDPSFSSSSCSDIEALYGVFYSSSDAASSSSNIQDKVNCVKLDGESKVTCNDGLTCEEKATPIFDCTEGPCPLYGVPSSEEITYKCDNDQTYTEEEFLKDHEINRPVALYGVFYSSSSDESASSDKKK